MLTEIVEVLTSGDDRGNGTVIRIRMPSGLHVLGFSTPNVYGGEWDQGPTWNYLVEGDRPFLVDAGRWGMGGPLLAMLEEARRTARDVSSIVVTHGHEDHDGGLPHLLAASGGEARAHVLYSCLHRIDPAHAPPDFRSSFPAACWRCVMPESFTLQHCQEYQRRLAGVEAKDLDEDGWAGELEVAVFHLPGHSPDAVALLVGGEVLLVGDTVLPGITPFPSLEVEFDRVEPVLPERFRQRERIYGLRAYLSSLARLRAIAESHPGLLVLPGHRLLWEGRWQELDLSARVDEIVQHHKDRCAAILEIVAGDPKTAREIAPVHFEPRLLRGLGARMAENEIFSHCELLVVAGDLRESEPGAFQATGSCNFEALIDGLGAA